MCLYMETRNFVLLLTSQYSTAALLPCRLQPDVRGPVVPWTRGRRMAVCLQRKTFRAYCLPAVGSKTRVIKIDFDNKFI